MILYDFTGILLKEKLPSKSEVTPKLVPSMVIVAPIKASWVFLSLIEPIYRPILISCEKTWLIKICKNIKTINLALLYILFFEFNL